MLIVICTDHMCLTVNDVETICRVSKQKAQAECSQRIMVVYRQLGAVSTVYRECSNFSMLLFLLYWVSSDS